MTELNLLPQDKPNYTYNVLKIASAGAIVASAVVAPNIISLFAKQLKSGDQKRALRAVRHARDNGWLTFRETAKGVEVALTASGKIKWQTVELHQRLHETHWDGRWRLVVFDIPVGNKAAAEAFRYAIKQLGLQQLQRSVWITPYACQTQIALLRQMYGLKTNVRLIEATSIDGEEELKVKFHLS